MKIVILILIGIGFVLFLIDYLTTKDIADNMFIDDETYNHQYITALNNAVNYYEEHLGRRLTKGEYNKLKYKIFDDFYRVDRYR